MRHWRFAKFKNLRFVFVRHRRSFELTFSSSCMGGLAEPVNEIAANSAFSLSAESFSTPSKNGGHFNLMPTVFQKWETVAVLPYQSISACMDTNIKKTCTPIKENIIFSTYLLFLKRIQNMPFKAKIHHKRNHLTTLCNTKIFKIFFKSSLRLIVHLLLF